MTSVSRRPVYQGCIVDLGLETLILPNGLPIELEVVRHSGAAAVVPILPDGRVVLIRQFRHAGGGYLLELPAGRLEPGEAPEHCAVRELQEETGYTARRWRYLLPLLTTPGFTDEVIHLFLAEDLEGGPTALEADECIESAIIPLSEALNAILRGEIRDGKTVVGLFTASAHLGRLSWPDQRLEPDAVPHGPTGTT